MPPAVAKLPWIHNVLLIDKIKDKNIRFWYANDAANGNWSKVVLDRQISMNLYERQVIVDKSNNFKNSLIEPQSVLSLLKSKYIERELQETMINRIRDVLLEFGNGFSFIGKSKKMRIWERKENFNILK